MDYGDLDQDQEQANPPSNPLLPCRSAIEFSSLEFSAIEFSSLQYSTRLQVTSSSLSYDLQLSEVK